MSSEPVVDVRADDDGRPLARVIEVVDARFDRLADHARTEREGLRKLVSDQMAVADGRADLLGSEYAGLAFRVEELEWRLDYTSEALATVSAVLTSLAVVADGIVARSETVTEGVELAAAVSALAPVAAAAVAAL